MAKKKVTTVDADTRRRHRLFRQVMELYARIRAAGATNVRDERNSARSSQIDFLADVDKCLRSKLTPRDATLLVLVYGSGWSTDEIEIEQLSERVFHGRQNALVAGAGNLLELRAINRDYFKSIRHVPATQGTVLSRLVTSEFKDAGTKAIAKKYRALRKVVEVQEDIVQSTMTDEPQTETELEEVELFESERIQEPFALTLLDEVEQHDGHDEHDSFARQSFEMGVRGLSPLEGHMSSLNNLRTSYLVAAIRRNIANQPSIADQLAEVEKRGKGRSSYAEFLRDELATEKKAEQINTDRIHKLESVLNADALAAEAQRKELVVSMREQNPDEQRLNSYQDKTTDIEGWKNYTEKEWCSLALNAAEEVKLVIVPTLIDDELGLILQYMCTNGFYVGSAEAWIRAFKALCHHGVIRQPLPAAEVVPVPTPGKFDAGRAEVEALRAEALKHKYGSRDREALERRAYQLELTIETVGGQYAEILQEIVDQSQLVLSTANNLKFQNFLQSPVAKRRFTNSREDVRMAFAEYFGFDKFLSEDERATIACRRGVEGMTSDDVKRQVGSRNTYDPKNDTYRANPTAGN